MGAGPGRSDIQETNILTGGISAEYGRFSGGVINMITKSGGNIFSGSFRENFSNPKWITQTPRELDNNIVHSDILSKTSEATFGGSERTRLHRHHPAR